MYILVCHQELACCISKHVIKVRNVKSEVSLGLGVAMAAWVVNGHEVFKSVGHQLWACCISKHGHLGTDISNQGSFWSWSGHDRSGSHK